MYRKVWCNVFGKGTQPFDFIKCNEIWKLTNEVKYISQTCTMHRWIAGIKINNSNKSKVKKSSN